MGSRIAMFTCEFPPYPGGIATYASETASALLRLGHRPVVFAPKCRAGRFDAPYPVIRCFPEQYRHAWLPWNMSMAALQLAQKTFDIVMAVDLPSVLALAAVPTSARKIAIVHGTDVKSRIIGHINRYSPRSPFNAFQRIYANSAFTRDVMLAHNPLVDRVRLAPLGVDDYWKRPLAGRRVDDLVARHLAGSRNTIALSVARLEPRKGLLPAMEAIAALPKPVRDNVTYIIAGRPIEAAYAERLRQRAAQIDADIRILGEVTRDEIRALYQTADLFIHTATKDRFRAEGFGLVLLEAAASGLPCIATRVDAIPEVVVDGVTGLLFDDADAAGISGGIARLIGDTALRTRLAAASRDHAANFTWDRCAEIIVDDLDILSSADLASCAA
ncbi:glycosyltransferase family 4 protein [Bradyrhizobium sp.]|uniref:glycosyltransferase family 4 protein n=1 Tax=Bradyrhizobium sp. TaxID=376 RepID=UPI001EC0FB90|nr:glycosyltransferase family 4 protein [Bradyrhizobium sp.]MBV9984820.1 glycosyltransferase family 4 protein [Bradyrhizobium sp.]